MIPNHLDPKATIDFHQLSTTSGTSSKIRARANGDFQGFINAVHAFCHDEPGHSYVIEYQQILDEIRNMRASVNHSLVDAPENLNSRIEQSKHQIMAGIAAVPVSIETIMLEAQTPFTAYRQIKALCETTASILICTDPFLDMTVFHRFLADVPAQTEITLVSGSRSEKNKKDQQRYDEFIDVSKMFAKQRKNKYQLFVENTFHDRWLRCDEQLFHSGGSLKDAADKSVYTLTKIDSTPENKKKIEDLIVAGTELFGPNAPTHQS